MTPRLARRSALLAICIAGPCLLAACGHRAVAPTFSYTLLDGTHGSTADLRGQVLLVNFWATSCTVCVAEMPQIVATHTRFSSRGLQTLAVSMNYDAPASVAHFAESRRLPFDVVIDNTGAIAKAFGPVEATPTTFLIDKHGAIAQRYVGAPDFALLQAQVEKLLAES